MNIEGIRANVNGILMRYPIPQSVKVIVRELVDALETLDERVRRLEFSQRDQGGKHGEG